MIWLVALVCAVDGGGLRQLCHSLVKRRQLERAKQRRQGRVRDHTRACQWVRSCDYMPPYAIEHCLSRDVRMTKMSFMTTL